MHSITIVQFFLEMEIYFHHTNVMNVLSKLHQLSFWKMCFCDCIQGIFLDLCFLEFHQSLKDRRWEKPRVLNESQGEAKWKSVIPALLFYSDVWSTHRIPWVLEKCKVCRCYFRCFIFERWSMEEKSFIASAPVMWRSSNSVIASVRPIFLFRICR